MNKTLGFVVILLSSRLSASVHSAGTAEPDDATQRDEVKAPALLGFQCTLSRSGLDGDQLIFALSQEADKETFVFQRMVKESPLTTSTLAPLRWGGLVCSLADDVVACHDPRSTNKVSLERWSKKSTHVTRKPSASLSTFWRLSLFSKEYDSTTNEYVAPVAKPLHAINVLRVAEKMEIIPGIDYDFLDQNSPAGQTCIISTEESAVR